ncbi:MAG: rRNA (cytidine1920-2-O)/16S rRNA (cytidine1409-2-O)-methyltransferase, partial [Solirubrobacterales bacterium]|nr:rRNA (cytidine1920-2-O)/16S rRNA (cytidine1409-2-O)-methyltransferase [Solirubrobacterales bacterium]
AGRHRVKKRLDVLLVERGLAESRAQAQALVMAGRVPGHAKAGEQVDEHAVVVVDAPPRFVSRAGEKLEHALERLDLDVRGLDCLDVGASTGGFTDCLLQRGAEIVIAVDVGYGQLDWSLREDSRVLVMERLNARQLGDSHLPFRPALITVDVSFISLAKLMPSIVASAAEEFDLLGLVKPQFELSKEKVGKGGVVRDADDRRDAIREVAEAAQGEGLIVRGLASSGLPGPKGNQETFVWASRSGDPVDLDAALLEVEP